MELSNEELIKKFPYLKDLAKYTIFTSKEEIDRQRNGEIIKIDSTDVSIEFLKNILSNDLYYEYATRFFTNEINTFSVSYILNGDIGRSIEYKKSAIIKGLEQLITTGKISLNEKQKQRYQTLKNSISFEKFLEKYQSDTFTIDIDNKKYTIPIEQIISLMQLSSKEFDNVCSNDEIKDLNGIPKVHFIYAYYKFFIENKIFDEFNIPQNIIDRHKELGSLQKIDFQAINNHLNTTDTKYQKVQINNELKRSIITGIPENATNLEKAIYIYIKMCKLLTYDEEYFAVNQKGPATEKHKSIDYVSTITPSNNKVVCFEFNLIYSKLLNELGINFESYYKGMIGESYGDVHANLEFRTDKFLVFADSVTSILNGDIMQAKLNQPLVGLKCTNKNNQTQKEFKEALTKMYKLIIEQQKSRNKFQKVEHVETLEELLEEYSHLTNNISDIDINERLSILIDKVNSTKMIGVDSLSYVLQLRKILFTEEQRKNNIKVTILKNNKPFDKEKIAMASAIFTLNHQSFDEFPEQNIYYYFNPNQELQQLSKEELQSMFDSKIFEYIENDDPRIPGIIESGGLKQ